MIYENRFKKPFISYSVTGTDSIKQVELEFLSSPNGLTNIIEMINSIYGSSVLNTLRIYDLDKVCSFFGYKTIRFLK